MYIQSCPPMPSRPCKFCLAIQNSSVFLDLDIDQDGCLYLVRISFDGYGCCIPRVKSSIRKIDSEKSRRLIGYINKGELEKPDAAQIISEHLRQNAEFLWADALSHHQLI